MNTTQKTAFFSTAWAVVLLFYSANNIQAQRSDTFDRTVFYRIIASEDLNAINSQIETVNKSGQKDKEAFEGALMMKRAGLLKGASKKLKEFKAGREKLENSMSKYADNAELKFLRLIIQENAPGILGYNKALKDDHKYIVAHFKSIPEATQNAIRNYSKSSKVLSPSDF